MNRLGGILNKLAQTACTETGTTSGWAYRKYADGTFEAWYNGTTTATIGTATGNIYTSGAVDFTPPSFASSVTGVWGQALISGYSVWFAIVSATPSKISTRMLSSLSRASGTYNINFYIRGTY